MTTRAFTTSARVRVYNKVGPLMVLDPSVVVSDGPWAPDGLQLLSCASSNAMGQGGQFQLTFKLPLRSSPWDFLDAIDDDSWVDISYIKNNVSWHSMRGLVDEMRVQTSAQNGTTVTVCTVTGRSFQKAYQTTPVWYHPTSLQNQDLQFLFSATGGTPFLNGSPRDNVKRMLFKLMDTIGSVQTGGRANWLLPTDMPIGPSLSTAGLARQAKLVDVVQFDDYLAEPKGLTKRPACGTLAFGDADLWGVAQAWSDPYFCEMFTELMPLAGTTALALDPGMRNGLTENQSCMTVVFRDKPFIIVSPECGRPVGLASSYFRLPVSSVDYTEMLTINFGKSGFERFNAFLFAGTGQNDTHSVPYALDFPLWSPADMAYHGMRRMDAQGIYNAGLNVAEGVYRNSQRALMRDYYCMAAQMLNGVMVLRNARPDLRVGNRIVVSNGDDKHFLEGYAEGVAHQWTPGNMNTQVQFTRGFHGEPRTFISKLITAADAYTQATS